MHGGTKAREISIKSRRPRARSSAGEIEGSPMQHLTAAAPEVGNDGLPWERPARSFHLERKMSGSAKVPGGDVVPRLRIDGLSHQFTAADGRKVQAISGISLDVAPGSFVSLIGQSGCGKSTLFNILAGLLTPTAGRVVLDGRDITGRA